MIYVLIYCLASFLFNLYRAVKKSENREEYLINISMGAANLTTLLFAGLIYVLGLQ